MIDLVKGSIPRFRKKDQNLSDFWPRQLSEGVTALGDMEGSLPVRDSLSASCYAFDAFTVVKNRQKVTTSMWFAQCSISSTVDTMRRETWKRFGENWEIFDFQPWSTMPTSIISWKKQLGCGTLRAVRWIWL